MSGERYYTTKIWQRPSSIEFSSAGALSTSMDPPGEPVISTWKRPCQKIQNGSEFPELVAQNFRNPQFRHRWAPEQRGEVCRARQIMKKTARQHADNRSIWLDFSPISPHTLVPSPLAKLLVFNDFLKFSLRLEHGNQAASPVPIQCRA